MIEKLISVARLALLFSLVVPGTPAVHGQAQLPGGGPSVGQTGSIEGLITKVINRGVVGDDATLVIRLEWSTSVPPLIRVLGFTAFVDVEYADGTTNSNTSNVAADVRQADLRVLNKGANTPKRFKARVETRFKLPALTPFTFSTEFDLNLANNFTSPPRRTSRELIDIRGWL